MKKTVAKKTVAKKPMVKKPMMKKGGMTKAQVGIQTGSAKKVGTPNPNKYVQSNPSGGYNEISARQYATTPQGQRIGMQELSPAQYEQNKSRITPMNTGAPMKAKKGGMVKTAKKKK